jgi:transcriptional regulator with XRE-family HTH domain
MTAQEFKSARLAKGWTEAQAARLLKVSQGYLNYLEHGKRTLTSGLLEKATAVYGLSPENVPLPVTFTPRPAPHEELFESLARLGYPGFAHFRSQAPPKNPREVLLTALSQERLDAGVAEALPWVMLRYGQDDPWLVENARRFNLQNRLGFVVSLARRIANRQCLKSRSEALLGLEKQLEESRLVKEDAFYRPPRTESEKKWLRQNRSKEAAHWKLLTDMKPAHLQYTFL